MSLIWWKSYKASPALSDFPSGLHAASAVGGAESSSYQPTSRRNLIWPLRKSPNIKSSTASSLGSKAWVLVWRRNSSLDSLQRIGGAQRLPLREREASESEELITGFLETLIDRLAGQLPLARETTPRLLDRLAAFRVDHAPIVFRQLFAQMGGRLGQKVR